MKFFLFKKSLESTPWCKVLKQFGPLSIFDNLSNIRNDCFKLHNSEGVNKMIAQTKYAKTFEEKHPFYLVIAFLKSIFRKIKS